MSGAYSSFIAHSFRVPAHAKLMFHEQHMLLARSAIALAWPHTCHARAQDNCVLPCQRLVRWLRTAAPALSKL